jgi:hypothetical protein
LARQIEGEWADDRTNAEIDIRARQTASGTKVSVSSEGRWPELLLSPREAARLADALLRITAEAEPRTVRQVRLEGSSAHPLNAMWVLAADL